MNLLSFIKRRLTVSIGVLAIIGVVIFAGVFWRSVQAVAVLGLDSIRWNIPYVVDNLQLLYLHQGDNAFKSAIFNLEQKRFVVDAKLAYGDKKLLSRLYFYSNQTEKAEVLYRELLAEHPGDDELIKSLGLLLMRRGEIENCTNSAGLCRYPLVSPHFKPQTFDFGLILSLDSLLKLPLIFHNFGHHRESKVRSQ